MSVDQTAHDIRTELAQSRKTVVELRQQNAALEATLAAVKHTLNAAIGAIRNENDNRD